MAFVSVAKAGMAYLPNGGLSLVPIQDRLREIDTEIVETQFTYSNLQPSETVSNGSVGQGARYYVTTRTGGYGQYGNILNEVLVTAALPTSEFDVAGTEWITATNMTGGSIFGHWSGANTPSSALSGTYSGGGVIGQEINSGNRWADFGLLSDIGGTRWTVGMQLVPDVIPTSNTATSSVTISVASPAVVSWTAHGLTNGTPLYFGGDGTIPTGLVKGTTYYVIASGLTANSFQISATFGGSAINTTGSFVAPIYAIPSFPGSFSLVIAPSIRAHRWWVGTLLRYDTIMPGGHARLTKGGTSSAHAPLDFEYVEGYWTNGIDFSNAAFSNACMKFGAGQVSGTANAGGGVGLPATVAGFLVVDVSGTLRKIPYYAT